MNKKYYEAGNVISINHKFHYQPIKKFLKYSIRFMSAMAADCYDYN